MQKSDNNPTLRDFLYVIFKYKITIITFTFSCVLVATIYSYFYPSKYEASSKILVKMGRESVSPETGVVKPSTVITTARPSDVLNSEIELLKGRYIAEEIMNEIGDEILFPPKDKPKSIWQKIKSYCKEKLSILFNSIDTMLGKLGLKKKLSPEEKAILTLKKGLSAELIKDSNSVKVSFEYSDPALAARIVNTAVSIYIKHHMNVHRSTHALDFFLNQTSNFEEKLRESEYKLKEFKNKWNISAIEEQTSHLLKMNADLRSEIHKTDIELARLTKKISVIKNLFKEKTLSYKETDITNPNPVVDSFKLKLMDLKLKRLQLSLKYSEDNLFITSVNDEIKDVERELEKEELEAAVSIDIDALKAKKEKLNSILNKSNEELKKFNQLDLELQVLTMKVNENKNFYNTYFEKSEESRILQAMDNANMTSVKIVEPAYVPIIPVRRISFIPQKIFNIAISFFIGIFVSISIIALMETFDHSFKSSEDIEEYLDIRVLGTISDNKHLVKRSGFSTR